MDFENIQLAINFTGSILAVVLIIGLCNHFYEKGKSGK